MALKDANLAAEGEKKNKIKIELEAKLAEVFSFPIYLLTLVH